MPSAAQRLAWLLTSEPVALDRVMATVASVAPEPPAEDDVVGQLDALAEGAPAGPAAGGGPGADQLLQYVYGQLGFVGNSTDYYSPDNSLVHKVLAARRGLPLTLAMIGSEIARRVGVDLTVVGMPGHVLLGDGPRPQRWFDPFAGGAELDLEGCRQLFARFHPAEAFSPAMADPISGVAATVRLLGNLKLAYRGLGDLAQLVKVLELAVDLPSAPVTERLELAAALAALGRNEQAARQHDLLVTRDPERGDAHRAAALRHRARRN
jgi:regulator of sirC expression with transglutaminase-like and TPR domain